MKKDRKKGNSLEELIGELREESLSEEQAQQLRDKLGHNESSRKRFVEHFFLQAMLKDADLSESWAKRSTSKTLAFANPIIKYIALAACAAILFASGRFLIPSSSEVATAGTSRQIALVSSAKSVVGSAPGILQNGAWLRAGKLELESGTLELEFGNTATLMIEGPASLDLRGRDHAILNHGRLAAEVPESARGFLLEAPGAQIVDLGTAFSVSATEGEMAEIHVFSGEVETLVSAGETYDLNVVRMKTSDTFDVATVSKSVSTGEGFLRFPRRANEKPRTTGAIRFLSDAPKSVEKTELPSRENILAFQEKMGVTLPKDLPVTLSGSGRHSVSTDAAEDFLPAGMLVDSYYLHFDSGGMGGHWRASGSITFDRPIIGVLARVPHLEAGDAILGHQGVQYSDHPWRAIDTAMSAKTGRLEHVTLSEDRRTMTVIFSMLKNDFDQVRVLVEAGDENLAIR